MGLGENVGKLDPLLVGVLFSLKKEARGLNDRARVDHMKCF
jgi:hypothetical protein